MTRGFPWLRLPLRKFALLSLAISSGALLRADANPAPSPPSQIDDLKVAPWYFSIEEARAAEGPVLKLDLSDQGLGEVPPGVFELRELQLLILNGNQLTQLPPELAQLTDLSEIEVNNNALESFPEVILQFKRLNELELNGNRLAELPEALAELTHLTELEARANQLTALPVSLAAMTRLEEIKVDFNQLTAIAPEVFALPRLIEITFAHNRVTELTAHWDRNRTLRELDLSNNRLSALPDAIFDLPLDTCYLWQPSLPKLSEPHFRWLIHRSLNDSEQFALAHAETGQSETAHYYLDLLAAEAKRKGILSQARAALLSAKVHRILRESEPAEAAADEALALLKTFGESDAADEDIASRTEADAMRAMAESLLAQTEAEILNQRLAFWFRLFLVTCVVALSALIATLFFSRRRLQRAHRQLSVQKETIEEQAVHLARINATKDRLFSIIGHDLRNPFAAIRGLAERLERNGGTPRETTAARQAHLIAAAASEASTTLDNLLSWARSQDGSLVHQPSFFDVEDLFVTVLELHGPHLAAKNLTVDRSCDPGLQVFADRRMLEGALRNLVSNGIKFTPADGRLHLRAHAEEGSILISVEDNGVGLSPSQLAALQTPTPEASPRASRGLGLELCRDFVERNDGTLSVQSNPGEGTTFTMHFPLSSLPRKERKREMTKAD